MGGLLYLLFCVEILHLNENQHRKWKTRQRFELKIQPFEANSMWEVQIWDLWEERILHWNIERKVEYSPQSTQQTKSICNHNEDQLLHSIKCKGPFNVINTNFFQRSVKNRWFDQKNGCTNISIFKKNNRL